MDFKTLHETIPYVTGGKTHVMTFSPYSGILLAMPGRHQNDTEPVGADFVVMVSDEKLEWLHHQFTHQDLFEDIERKFIENSEECTRFFGDYVRVVFGDDPAKMDWHRPEEQWVDSLHPQTFLYSVQALAIAEHRRYHMHEARGGGRYLPMRLAYGIVAGAWTAADCNKHQRRGRPGLDMLQKLKEFDASSKAIKQAFNLP